MAITEFEKAVESSVGLTIQEIQEMSPEDIRARAKELSDKGVTVSGQGTISHEGKQRKN